MHIYVEKWLTPEEYMNAKEQKLLSWQAEDDRSHRPSTVSKMQTMASLNSKQNGSPDVLLLGSRLRPSGSLASLKAGSRNFTPLRRSVLASLSPGLGDLSFSPSSLSRSSSTISLSRSLAGAGPFRTLTPQRSILGFGTPERKQLSEAGRLQRQEELMKRLRGNQTSGSRAEEAVSSPSKSADILKGIADNGTVGKTSAAPTFSFGSTIVQSNPLAENKPAPALSLVSGSGTSDEPLKKDIPKAAVSFGAPIETGTSLTPAKTFSFGVNKAPESSSAEKLPTVPAAATSNSTPSFSFGAAPPALSTGQASVSTPAFSFGQANDSAPSANLEAVTDTKIPKFSFGSTEVSTSVSPSIPPPSSLSNGAQTAAGASQNSKSSFSFGQAEAPQAVPANTPSFSFGAPAPSSAPVNSTPSFTFGSSNTPASQSSFSFGTAAPNPAPAPASMTNTSNPGFSFGSGSAAPTSAGSRPMRPLRSRTGLAPSGNASDTSMASNRSGSPATFAFGAAPTTAAEGGFSFGVGKRSGEQDENGPAKKTFSFGR